MTAWSELGPDFLRDPSDPAIGDWAVGQGPDAPDRRHLRAILTELEPCTLLDVGCGTGIELDGILAEGLEVEYAGIDITKAFIVSAQARYPDADFAVGSVEGLYAPGLFDVVSARAVLEHLEDGHTALQRLWEACSKVCVVSWFIPPGTEDRVELTPDGFIHHHYSRIQLTDLIVDLNVGRFKSTWHRTPTQVWETWELWR